MFRQIERTPDGRGLKEHLLAKCEERKDKWAGEVRLRIQGAPSDLHAADARYHLDCRTQFVAEKSVKAAASVSMSVPSDSDQAFTTILKIMEGNMSKLLN